MAHPTFTWRWMSCLDEALDEIFAEYLIDQHLARRKVRLTD